MRLRLGARNSCQQRVGISDETRQSCDPNSLSDCSDLCLGVQGSEWNLRNLNFSLRRPIGNAVIVDDDPTEGIMGTFMARSQAVARYVNAGREIRPLQTMKIKWQSLPVNYDADRDIGLSVGQIRDFAGRQDFHLDIRMQTHEIGKVGHEQMCREKGWQRYPQKPARALVTPKNSRLQLV